MRAPILAIVGRRVDGDLAAVRRVGRRGEAAEAGDGADLTTLGGDQEEVGEGVLLARLMAGRGEGDGRAVGRPRRAVVVEAAVADLARLGAAGGGDDEDVGVAIVGVAGAVGLVAGGVDVAGALLPALLRLRVGGGGLRLDDGGEGDARAVRRPDRGAGAVGQVGEALGLAAGGGHHVELRLALAVGEEGEPGAVRRPARLGVTLLAARELNCLSPVHRLHPDGRLVAVGGRVDLVEHVGDTGAVRGDLGVRDGDEAIEVLRLGRPARAVHHDEPPMGAAWRWWETMGQG